jgi:hypothetical protein
MKAIFAIAAALALAGCSVAVTPKQVYVTANAFDVAEASATQYLKLPVCTDANKPLCKSPATAAKIVALIKDSRVIRDNLEKSIRTSGAPVNSDLLTALASNVSQIKSLIQDIAQ